MADHTNEVSAIEQEPSEGPSTAVFLVPALSPHEAGSWGRGQAVALAELGFARNDQLSIDLLATLLHVLALEQRPEGFAWRAILVPGMERAPISVDLGFVAAEGDRLEALDRLLGVGGEGPLGGEVSDLSLNGVEARQHLRFTFRDPDTLEEAETGELWVTAGVACRRDVGSLGATDIVAATDTPQVDAVLHVLPSIYDLVTGDELAVALQRGEPNGSDTP